MVNSEDDSYVKEVASCGVGKQLRKNIFILVFVLDSTAKCALNTPRRYHVAQCCFGYLELCKNYLARFESACSITSITPYAAIGRIYRLQIYFHYQQVVNGKRFIFLCLVRCRNGFFLKLRYIWDFLLLFIEKKGHA